MKQVASRLSDLILRSKPSPLGRRIARAMLLRMRFVEDADTIRIPKSLNQWLGVSHVLSFA